MPIAETLTAKVGSSVARAVARATFGESDLAADLAEMLARHATGFRERNRARRQFERLAEDVAEQLEPFIQTEFRAIPENEKLAAIHAVEDAINRANVTSDLLASIDLSASRLEAHARAAMGEQIANYALSEQATELYALLLTEACSYIVELAMSLGTANTASIRELLRRETYLHDLIQQVFRALPGHGLNSSTDDGKFELRYRREAAARLDRLELFGLSVIPASKRYALSVAYITLTAQAAITEGKTDEPSNESSENRDDSGAADYLRIDEVIAEENRVLVRGEAGSGKTTLLQWLAVHSARRSFEDYLSDWNDTVPFFIQLRRYVERELPKPEEFLQYVVPALHGLVPDGWVHRQLEEGRALVLVDGIDELPEERRPEVRDWLSDLVQTFPRARYIITSRPPAVEDGWLTIDGLFDAELQPMSPSDISEFIDHWYAAANSTPSGLDDGDELTDYALNLKALVRDNQSLRSLATLPLLCAMMCALHRERRAQLPRDRMQLYDIALDMMLERRDVERKIPTEASAGLSREQREILLRALAYNLIINGQSDIEESRAVALVERELARMPGIKSSAERVFSSLLIRSGLIREPVEGRIDFIHRTFQEYLAAKEAIELDHRGAIIEHAHLDSWREVVILAVGHARPSEREELIRGLLKRGREDKELTHRLHLLAVACLETSSRLSGDLTDELTERLRALVPPLNMTDAKAVASAGDLAAPLLSEFSDELATTAAACVRALAIIGTEQALQALEPYGHDWRVTVNRELIRAWDSFDSQEFARRVLATSGLDRGNLRLRDSARLPGVRYLQKLKDLRCWLTGVDSIRPLEDVQALKTLHLRRSDVSDLSPLRTTPKLSTLGLIHCTDIVDLSPVADLPELSVVSLNSCPSILNLAPLGRLPLLTNIEVVDMPQAGYWEEIESAEELRNLLVVESDTLERLDFLSDSSKLEVLRLVSCRELQSLEGLPSSEYRMISFMDLPLVTDFEVLADTASVAELYIHSEAFNDIGVVAEISGLESLSIIDNPNLTSIQDLARLESLEQIDLSGCEQLSDLTAIRGMGSLQYLSILGCREISGDSIDAIESLRDATLYLDVSHRSRGWSEEFIGANDVYFVEGYELARRDIRFVFGHPYGMQTPLWRFRLGVRRAHI